MPMVGVRELRREASRWVARVRAGETVVVTDRGRPVAKMVPLTALEGYESLLAEGRIAPGRGRTMSEVLRELDADLPPDEGPSVSEALASLRAEER